MNLLIMVAAGMLVAAFGGAAIALFLVGIIDLTSDPVDELARRDRQQRERA